MISEITVTVKDEEKTLKKKYLIYELYQVHDQDPIIMDCIEQTVKNFSSEPSRISVRINLQVE